MENDVYDVIVLSDLHLGSEVSRAPEALELLRFLKFRRLILLGDIFCDLNFRRLNKQHWQFLSYIRKLSNPKREVKVIWVEGNHDHGLSEVMSHLVGVPVYQQYSWDSAGEKYLAIHGHQFDSFIVRDRFCISGLANNAYLALQKIDFEGKHITRFLDRINTRWQRLTPKVADGAIAYAKNCGATRVFCGHTHDPIALMRDGIHYFNTGAWTNSKATYISVLGSEVQIHEYIKGIDYSDTGEKRRETFAAPAGFSNAAGLSADVEYQNILS
jgi:UDP-2,3-diacylglucosamine pyrophosphatase LpxH